MSEHKISAVVTVSETKDGANIFYNVKVFASKDIPHSVISELQTAYRKRLWVENIPDGVNMLHPHRFKDLSQAMRLAKQLGENIKDCLSEFNAEVKIAV